MAIWTVCLFLSFVAAQNAPLQWLNLSGAVKGSIPPLKDAVIGFDDTTRSLVVFGGESENGFAQSQTYLLNLDTLTWSTPSPPDNLKRVPPARSAALGASDFASNTRRGFVVIGGKGADGNALEDIWEYDFTYQFWSEVTVSSNRPSARWGAAGGIDIRTPALLGLNNTMYLSGGMDGRTILPLSDTWRLNISGTLAPNIPDSVIGTWQSIDLKNLPPLPDVASTVIAQDIISVSGPCDPSSTSPGLCDQSYAISTSSLSVRSINNCPVPRKNAVLVPNLNSFSPAFSSQVFLLLGIPDERWNDDGDSLGKGEVAVLDTQTGSWNRVLPAGDPGTTGKESYPGPREGAAAIASASGLVGRSLSKSSDTIVFGGKDASGKYLSELWILRSYRGAMSPSDLSWSGGRGSLQTGPDASGAGVRMEYIASCATLATSTAPSTTVPSTPNPTTTSFPADVPISYDYDTSTIHKVFAPVSVFLAFPAAAMFRLGPSCHWAIRNLRLVLVATSFSFGLTGLVVSFTSIHTAMSTGSPTLPSVHSKAGLVLFLVFYALLPLLWLIRLIWSRLGSATEDFPNPPGDPTEKETSVSPTPALAVDTRRSNLSHEGSDSESNISSRSPSKSFQVMNRPRPRPSQRFGSHRGDIMVEPGSLGDVDWLQRRRSLNSWGDLDFSVSQAMRAQQMASRPEAVPSTLVQQPFKRPSPSQLVLNFLFHLSLVGLSVLTLQALYARVHISAFCLFLVSLVAFYVTCIIMGVKGHPRRSLITSLLHRTVDNQPQQPSSSPHELQAPEHSPYTHHQPLVSLASSPRPETSPVFQDSDASDDDEETRQRRIEEEVDRRDVTIITVPKRPLWIANPS